MKSTQYIQLRVKSWIAMTIPWQSIYICFLIVFTKKTIIGFLFVFFAGFYTFQVSKTWRIRNYIVLDFVCPNHESGGYIDLPWSIRLEEVGFFGAGHPPVLFASLLYSVKVDLALDVKCILNFYQCTWCSTQSIDFGRYFWPNYSFLHIDHSIKMLFFQHIKVVFYFPSKYWLL